MGELLAPVAFGGVQVIVETHSDHLLNGVRLAVHREMLQPEDIALHYFQRDPTSGSTIVSPKLDKNGRINEWPDGFFDEWEKNLTELLV